MTQTTAEPTMPKMPDTLRAEANELIRNLAAVAGDADATYRQLRGYCEPLSKEAAFAGLAAALVLIFTECITTPTAAGEYAETSLPID